MATKERLIGADGLVEVGTLSDSGMITTSGVLASGVWYMITAAPTGTVHTVPGSLAKEGDLFKGPDSGTILASGVGLIMKPISFTSTPVADISSWSCEFSSDEIEVTVLADDVKKYRRGKTDASGSMKGIMILGTTSLTASGTLTRFLRNNKVSSAGANTLSAVGSSSLYFKGIMQKDRTSGEAYAFLFGQVELFNFSVGGDIGSAQEFDCKFRFINNDPIYVEETIA